MNLKSSEHHAHKLHHVMPRPLRRLARRAAYELRHQGKRGHALPDFYIIGTMKSGTTALYMHLEENPDVVPATRKEVHYFNTNRDMGPNFYRSFFPPAQALAPRDNAWGRQITGEATPDYAFHPAAAALCHAMTPDAKLIMIMRNPIERAFSHWKQGRRFKFETESFEDAIALEEARLAGEAEKLIAAPTYYSYRHQMYSYLARGRYAEQIADWMRHFDRAQFLFIKSEDMFDHGAEISAQVTDFLGIAGNPAPAISAKFKGISGDISAATRARLNTYFAPHNAELYALIGRDLGWQ